MMRRTFPSLAKLACSLAGSMSICMIISPPAAQTAEVYAGANNDLVHGEQAIKERNWDQAVFYLNAAIGSYDKDAKPYMLRGRAHFHLGHYALAIDDFNKVLQLSPNFFSAFMYRGSAHGKLGTDDLAIEDYEQAIRLNPRLAQRYFAAPGLAQGESKGVIAAQRYHIPGVLSEDLQSPLVTDYKAAMIRVYPNGWSPNAATRIGQANPNSYDTDANDEAYMSELAAGGIPANGASSNATADREKVAVVTSNHEQQGEGEERHRREIRREAAAAATADNQNNLPANSQGTYQALAANPAASKTTNIQGNLDIARSDDTLDARRNRRVATNVYDKDTDFGEFGAVPGSQPLKGDAERVLKNCNEALREDARNPEYLYLRAKAYQKLGKVDEAYKDYASAIDLNPDSAKYYVGRASMFFQLNKPLLVDADVRRAINCDQSLPHNIHFGGDPYPSNIKWSGSDDY